MRIKQLGIRDFRCFEELQVDFAQEHNVHVILAENMAGKSALMRALRVAASAYPAAILPQTALGIEPMDHRVIGANPVANRVLESRIEAHAILVDSTNKYQEVSWTKYKDHPAKGRTRTLYGKGFINPVQAARNIYEAATLGKSTLPLLNFIGTEYIHVLASKTGELSLDGNATEGYWDCFVDKSIQRFLFDWLERIDGILEEKARKPVVATAYGDLPDNAMFVFQQAVRTILPDIAQIDWLRDQKQPVVQFKNGDVRLFEMLSDGYRYLILLAGELATRAFILNKHLGKEVLQKVNGLVLIDEFGIHLHPGLQSDALKRLQETFPNVQFIISTHSPLLINGLKKEQIHLLEIDDMGKRTIRHPDEDAIGLGAEGILLHMFGLTTTYDTESLQWNEEYKTLYRKKMVEGLTAIETERFRELSLLLSAYRLDPSLKVAEEDSLVRTVREELTARKQQPQPGRAYVAETIQKQVAEILDKLI